VLTKESGGITASKISTALLWGAPLLTMSKIKIHSDSAAIAPTKPEMLESSKRYPKTVLMQAPAGYRKVSANRIHIKRNLAFFIASPYSFPSIAA
jgi:hypothetical protein